GRDGLKQPPDALLEGRPAQVERQVGDTSGRACEVIRQPPAGSSQNRCLAIVDPVRTEPALESHVEPRVARCGVELQRTDTGLRRQRQQIADRRWDENPGEGGWHYYWRRGPTGTPTRL